MYPSPPPQPHYMTGVHPRNKEKSFAKTLNLPLSTIWRETLLENHHVPPQTRLNAYIQIAGSDLYRRDLFTPVLYLTLPTRISTKRLLRVHTQGTEVGMLGGLGFKGAQTAADGSDHKGTMGQTRCRKPEKLQWTGWTRGRRHELQ